MSNDVSKQAQYFQEKVIGVMNNIHNIATENNIKYVLIFGSLIGAVRHGGFIPWDDDLDIGMMREDYDKLIDLLEKNLPEGQKAQTHLNDPFYFQHFCKVRLNDTDIREDYMAHFDITHGIWVDVLPFEKPLKDKVMETERVKIITSWYKLWSFITPVPNRNTNENVFKKTIKNIVQKTLIRSQKRNGFIIKMISKRHKKINSIINGEYYKEKGCEFSEDYVVSYSFKFHKESDYELYSMNTTDITESITTDFAGIKSYIPKDYDGILRLMYGDYMQLPKEADRVANHRILDSNFNVVNF